MININELPDEKQWRLIMYSLASVCLYVPVIISLTKIAQKLLYRYL